MSETPPEDEGPAEHGDSEDKGSQTAPETDHDEGRNGDVLIAERLQQEERNAELRLADLRKLNAERTAAAGRDWFEGRTNHASDSGVINDAARDINFFASPDAPPVRTAPVSHSELRLLQGCVVETESQIRLAKLLGDHPVLLLRGSPGTGRTTTALAALLDFSKACHRLIVKDDPCQVSSAHLEPGVGYVLRADQKTWTSHLDDAVDHLSAVAARSGSRIVIVAGPDLDLPHRAVDHEQPAADEVCRKALAYLLDDPAAWQVHKLDEHGIADRLSEGRPAEAYQLADRLADAVRHRQPLDDVLVAQPLTARRRFREHLKCDTTTRTGLCFLASSAVLHGLSETTVTDAAFALARATLEGTKAGEEPDDALVRERIANWLSYPGISTAEGRHGKGRRVQLKGGLIPFLLPMIWEELPAIREHLYPWLRHLGSKADEHIRIKVAHAVGLLAVCDFELIEAEFLQPWSRDSKVGSKQLAAWTMEAAAGDPAIRDRVQALLHSWAAYGNYEQRTTAAIAYGSPTSTRQIGETLASFSQITRATRNYWLCDAVARSISDIYTAETASHIIAELADWARHDTYWVRLAAALALVRLSPLRRYGTRPPLADHGTSEDLCTIWVRSLELSLIPDNRAGRRSGLAGRLWELLAEWAAAWDEQPALRPVIEGVFSIDRTHNPRLHRTFQLYLLLWERKRTITTAHFHHLARLLKKG
ncbi:DNA alkylation repair protein [Sinosporangium siamense]|uniref:Uncharacterized protein n=1 Tax=Sinosporangium siamense TaxID=1367973 RepID=A0A919VED4_9ACTN|nr:DNA alkylation repair protein [Sinosporangium siamense]GII95014.1 hypothetical protein Ssi02_52450 [Sinosporangium siamense]